MVDLVTFDLDGTLLDHSGQPAPSGLAALRELIDKGIPFASISGRSVRRSLQPLAAYPDLTRRMHVCGYNGAVGVGPGEEGQRPLLYARRLPEEVFLELVDFGSERNFNLTYCRCEEGEQGLVEEYRFLCDTEDEDSAIDWRGPGYAYDPQLIENIRSGQFGPPPKIMFLIDPAQQERILNELEERFGDRIYVAWAVRGVIEIMPPGTDKGVALQALAEAISVPIDRIMAIGDGNNDLPMLSRAGLGVLMGNAEEEIQKAIVGTDIRLAPPFSADGFARSLRQYAG
ncbi:MAG: HAD family hydrolase [Gemmatimonadetes bacterium]|nr:HAD family hydrolase [Gemmatimonadota bacterium]